MNIKKVLVVATLGFLSLSSYADQTGEAFQKVCINSWMEKIEGS